MANIDYAKLLRDRRLDIAIGIGYEFAGEIPGFSNELNVIVAILKANRFVKKTIVAADPYYDTYFLRKKFTGANLQPIDIDIYIYLTSSHKKAPAQVFASFLATSEIVIYSGHARVGIGPDFDDEKSSAQNFIIGLNSAAHLKGQISTQQSPHDLSSLTKYRKAVSDRKDNDLENISKKNLFREDLYQVWFFNACTSIDYVEEIRGKWFVKDKARKHGLVRTADGKMKSKENLVLFGTKYSVVADASRILTKLLEGKTMDDIIKAMNEYEKILSPEHKNRKSIYFSD